MSEPQRYKRGPKARLEQAGQTEQKGTVIGAVLPEVGEVVFGDDEVIEWRLDSVEVCEACD